MKATLRNRLRMLTNTLGHFDEHPDAWSGHPPLVQHVEALRAAHGRMAGAGDDQAANDPKGLTKQKTKARKAAAKALADLGLKATTYAVDVGDEVLRRAVDHARSEWERMPEGTFASKAKDALDRIEAQAEPMAAYGVAPRQIGAAREAVAEVARLTERRDNTDAGRSVATDDIEDAYSDDAVPTLAQLDRLVPTLVTDAAFVARYGEVRQIVGD